MIVDILSGHDIQKENFIEDLAYWMAYIFEEIS